MTDMMRYQRFAHSGASKASGLFPFKSADSYRVSGKFTAFPVGAKMRGGSCLYPKARRP